MRLISRIASLKIPATSQWDMRRLVSRPSHSLPSRGWRMMSFDLPYSFSRPKYTGSPYRIYPLKPFRAKALETCGLGVGEQWSARLNITLILFRNMDTILSPRPSFSSPFSRPLIWSSLSARVLRVYFIYVICFRTPPPPNPRSAPLRWTKRVTSIKSRCDRERLLEEVLMIESNKTSHIGPNFFLFISQ